MKFYYLSILVLIINLCACKKNTVGFKQELEAPSDLRANPSGHVTIRLEWNDNNKTELGFQIERKDDNIEWQTIAKVSENSTSYKDTSANFKTSYIYRIASYNTTSISKYSNKASIDCQNFFDLVFVKGDTFTMGDSWGDGTGDSTPNHLVELNSYYIGKYEITNTQIIDLFNWALNQNKIYVSSYLVFLTDGDFTALMDLSDYNSAYGYDGEKLFLNREPDNPATDVSWFGALAYCNFLTENRFFPITTPDIQVITK